MRIKKKTFLYGFQREIDHFSLKIDSGSVRRRPGHVFRRGIARRIDFWHLETDPRRPGRVTDEKLKIF